MNGIKTEGLKNFSLTVVDGDLKRLHGLNPISAHAVVKALNRYLDACIGDDSDESNYPVWDGLNDGCGVSYCFFPNGKGESIEKWMDGVPVKGYELVHPDGHVVPLHYRSPLVD